jgi:hypothetical protein
MDKDFSHLRINKFSFLVWRRNIETLIWLEFWKSEPQMQIGVFSLGEGKKTWWHTGSLFIFVGKPFLFWDGSRLGKHDLKSPISLQSLTCHLYLFPLDDFLPHTINISFILLSPLHASERAPSTPCCFSPYCSSKKSKLTTIRPPQDVMGLHGGKLYSKIR